MLVSGFVIWELLAEWPRGAEAFLAAPHWLAVQLGSSALAGLSVGSLPEVAVVGAVLVSVAFGFAHQVEPAGRRAGRAGPPSHRAEARAGDRVPVDPGRQGPCLRPRRASARCHVADRYTELFTVREPDHRLTPIRPE
jgi:hypothetical protein